MASIRVFCVCDKVNAHIHTAPSQILPSEIPFDRIKIGPAFPNAGGLFLEFPTFDLAVRITAALEKSPNCPKIIMIPTVYVSRVEGGGGRGGVELEGETIESYMYVDRWRGRQEKGRVAEGVEGMR